MRRTGTRCGTVAGYARHRHSRQRPCDQCVAAHNSYMRRYRKRRTGRTVPAIGVTRRLQALAYDGHPGHAIAAELQTATSHLLRLMRGEFDTVYASTHHAVVDMYDRWAGTPGSSSITARRARKAGHAPWWTWDDETIDDPQAGPNYTGYDEERVQAYMVGVRPVGLTKADRVEAVVRLANSGLTPLDVARTVGVRELDVQTWLGADAA